MGFSFYQIDSQYCNFLRQTDPCVPYNNGAKAKRPFVGIVFSVNDYNYYAPLTSPKPKHLKMKNQMDFLKINNGLWGAINFNNMIPVHKKSLQKVDVKIYPTDTKNEIDYKNLLSNQLSWCNANKKTVLDQAEKLYNTIVHGNGWAQLHSRCCNFVVDEKQYLVYCAANGFIRNTNAASQDKDDLEL